MDIQLDSVFNDLKSHMVFCLYIISLYGYSLFNQMIKINIALN
jgi:hypothetical protein